MRPHELRETAAGEAYEAIDLYADSVEDLARAPSADDAPPHAPVIYDARRNTWVLHDRFVYRDHERGRTIVIPAGFEFDLASIPRQVWWLIALHECSVEAALVHDFLYRCAGKWTEGNYTRHEADVLFLDMMRLYGVGKVKRLAAYRAVRAFGAGAWQRETLN